MSQMSGWFAREFVFVTIKNNVCIICYQIYFWYNTFAAKMQRGTGEMTTTNSPWPTLMVNICIFKPNTFYSKCNWVIRPIIWFAHSCLNDDSFFCVIYIYYSGNVCFWCYLLTNPFSCLETAMGRRKYHRGKRVRITGVQWCLSQVGRIEANSFKFHSSDCKRNGIM